MLFLPRWGCGSASLVDRGGQLPGGVPYLAFLAPGLLAATAMQIGSASRPTRCMGAIKWDSPTTPMLATPLGVHDVLTGHLLYIAFRVPTSVDDVPGGAGRLRRRSTARWSLLALPGRAAHRAGVRRAGHGVSAVRMENDSGFAAC